GTVNVRDIDDLTVDPMGITTKNGNVRLNVGTKFVADNPAVALVNVGTAKFELEPGFNGAPGPNQVSSTKFTTNAIAGGGVFLGVPGGANIFGDLFTVLPGTSRIFI